MQLFPWLQGGKRVPRHIITLSYLTLTNHLHWLVTYWTRPGLAIIHVVSTLSMTMDMNLNFTFKPCVNHLWSSTSQPVSRTHKQMLYHSIIIMLCTAELDMANIVETSDIDGFLTDVAWAICSTYYTVLKASLEAAIFTGMCCLIYPFLLTGTKLEIAGNARQTSMQNVKIAHVVIGTTKLLMQYLLEKMVSSANQKVSMTVILGLSHRFI